MKRVLEEEPQSLLCIRATADIGPGDPLYMDYGKQYWASLLKTGTEDEADEDDEAAVVTEEANPVGRGLNMSELTSTQFGERLAVFNPFEVGGSENNTDSDHEETTKKVKKTTKKKKKTKRTQKKVKLTKHPGKKPKGSKKKDKSSTQTQKKRKTPATPAQDDESGNESSSSSTVTRKDRSEKKRKVDWVRNLHTESDEEQEVLRLSLYLSLSLAPENARANSHAHNPGTTQHS